MYKKLHGLKPTILRVANPYGERQSAKHMQGAVGVFLEKALADQAIEIWGDGSITRDYIYVGDVAKAFSKAKKQVKKRQRHNQRQKSFPKSEILF